LTTSETYGKWHTPVDFFYSKTNPRQRIVENNYFDFRDDTPKFKPVQSFKALYQPQLDYMLQQDNVSISYGPGEQRNPMTQKPYTPGLLDPRYG